MKKLMSTISAVGIALASFADISTVPLSSGLNTIGPARIIAVKAAGSTSSGELSISEIIDVASVTNTFVDVTNIVPNDVTRQIADAYVGQMRVYTGSNTTAWSNVFEVVTNVTGSVTNVYTIRIGTLYDNGVEKYHPVTNQACSVAMRDITSHELSTNVVRRTITNWYQTPYTNEIYSGSMSGGKLSVVTNLVILGGKIDVSGTALSGGNAYLVIEK